jgi:serine/threonine-protein kinase
MLGGEPPFTGPTTQIVIARACHEEPRRLHVVRPAVTPEMDKVIAKALAKVASDRFATAGAFIDALESLGATPAGARAP